MPLLAEWLGARGNHTVCLVLPECFRIDTRFARRVELEGGQIFDDIRVEWTLAEFNRIAELAGRRQPCFICDDRALVCREGSVYLEGSAAVGCVYRRSSRIGITASQCRFVNDIRARLVCGDKMNAHAILAPELGPAAPPMTLPLVFRPDVVKILQECADADRPVVIKPRWGSASIGVERVAANQVLDGLRRGGSREDRVVQPWIPLDCVGARRRLFRYDVRLFVLCGRVIGGFGRRASAAAGRAGGESKLGWLTTTGPLLPIAVPGEPAASAEGSIPLSEPEFTAVCATACQAVRALDFAARRLSYDSAQRIPAFAELQGEAGPIRPVRLRGVA